MRKKKKVIHTMLVTTCVILFMMAIMFFVMNKIYSNSKQRLYENKIDMLESYCKIIINNTLSIDSDSINKLKNLDEELKIIYDGAVEDELYKATTYNMIDEEIKNIEIYEIDNSSSNLVYKYFDDVETLNIDISFLTRNDIEVIGEVVDNNFVVIMPIKNTDNVKIGVLKIVSSMENYIAEVNEYRKTLNVMIAIVFVIGVVMLINKYIFITNTYDLDFLTGLSSKSNYKVLIEKMIKNSPNEKGQLIVIGFRDIEDYDMQNVELIEEVIYGFAQILKKYKSSNNVLARVSEQKIGIYKHGIQDEKELIDKLIIEVEQYLRDNKKFKTIQYYMGVSYYPEQEKAVEPLVNGAIYAIERLKKEKKQYHSNNYLIYDPKAHREYIDKQYLYDEVEKIIRERKIYVVFQPIVDLRTGEIFGYEALSRPISELVPNISMLITLGEEMNITTDLEMLLIYQINKTVYEMKEKFDDKHLFINTNVSIKYGEKEIEKFKYIIEKIVKNLVIEITEYNEIDFSTITEKVTRVKNFGAKIAIDDFGSGYSNELALLSLLPDIVKIDMRLIRDIDKDERKLEIVKNLTTYAKKNNIVVLAEGVETPEELKVVLSMDIELVQGYIFAKPDREVLNKSFDVEKYAIGRK